MVMYIKSKVNFSKMAYFELNISKSTQYVKQ